MCFHLGSIKLGVVGSGPSTGVRERQSEAAEVKRGSLFGYNEAVVLFGQAGQAFVTDCP